MTSAELLPAAVLNRKAVVYIRQSTQAQVQTNLESQRRQYDLVDVARQRGFHNIEVIDEALVQIAGTSRQSLLRCAMFRPEAPRSRLQVQLDLERRDVAVRTVPCGCGVAARCRRS